MKNQVIKFWPLVPCAGTGSRSGAAGPKQYVTLEGKTVVAHTLAALGALACLEPVTVIIAPEDHLFLKHCPNFSGSVAKVGGDTRGQSVRAGLKVLRELGAKDSDWVLVHDAARCLIEPQWVSELIEHCKNDDVGGLLAYAVPDTLKQSENGRALATVSRQNKWLAQTPQMFRLALLERALDEAFARCIEITDEASAVEALGLHPLLVPCSADNFKLTYPSDFERAAALLRAKEGKQMMSTVAITAPVLRIGEGWDTHPLVDGRPLMLGGLQVPHDKGLDGHSDADVLLHAMTDALLGAAGLGDIGRHFPDTDPQFKGADSAILLQTVYAKVKSHGWQLSNLDATVIAQAPKLAPHIPGMLARVAQILGCDAGKINIKAKTAEKMGPVGEGLSIEARAVCLLVKN